MNKSEKHKQKISSQFDYGQKVNLANLYNKNEEYQLQQQTTSQTVSSKHDKFQDLLNEKIVNMGQLRDLAWHGIPDGNRSLKQLKVLIDQRSTVWKILLNYSSPNKDASVTILERKRTQYYEMCNIYFSSEAANLYDDREKKIIKLIESDITRNNPSAPIFRNPQVQEMLRRVLFIWNVRNPACGYVQGINDIVSIYLIVFLSEFVDVDLTSVRFPSEKQVEHLDIRIVRQVEADCYWCLSKMLDNVIDNYTQEQPGLLRYYNRLIEIMVVLDKPLLDHFDALQINLYTGFIFKWVNCLLLRLFSFAVGVRLFDTFIAEDNNYFEFSLYIVATILLKHSKKIKKMPQEETMFFLEKMPTIQWSDGDLDFCLAEAYSYKQILQKK